jgi:ribosome biogenesis GTPase
MNLDLITLGYDSWFDGKAKDLLKPDFRLARVTAVNKNNYFIRNEHSEILAEISGRMKYRAESSLDLPTVGDWAIVQYFDDDTFAIIHDILPRKTVLKRKYPGRIIECQIIAANIDIVFIMQAINTDFNLNRLERYLVLVNESHVLPVILLSKCDLISKKEIERKLKSLERLKNQYKIIPFSNKINFGMKDILEQINIGKTYCLLGSSGVGKTTLLNKLMGEDVLAVNNVREKNGKGKHTTNRRQLICLKNGGLFIDTPGMRELGNFNIEKGLSETYNDIYNYVNHCKFTNCTHINEKGCAVLEAVKDGIIDENKYNNFVKIQKEAEFYEMSYLEKRRKDRKFGKMYKQFKKDKKINRK